MARAARTALVGVPTSGTREHIECGGGDSFFFSFESRTRVGRKMNCATLSSSPGVETLTVLGWMNRVNLGYAGRGGMRRGA